MQRWKNYGLWVSIFSLIPLIFSSLSVYDINILLPQGYSQIVQGILGILVVAGVISDPKEGKWYTDDVNAKVDESINKSDEV